MSPWYILPLALLKPLTACPLNFWHNFLKPDTGVPRTQSPPGGVFFSPVITLLVDCLHALVVSSSRRSWKDLRSFIFYSNSWLILDTHSYRMSIVHLSPFPILIKLLLLRMNESVKTTSNLPHSLQCNNYNAWSITNCFTIIALLTDRG